MGGGRTVSMEPVLAFQRYTAPFSAMATCTATLGRPVHLQMQPQPCAQSGESKLCNDSFRRARQTDFGIAQLEATPKCLKGWTVLCMHSPRWCCSSRGGLGSSRP